MEGTTERGKKRIRRKEGPRKERGGVFVKLMRKERVVQCLPALFRYLGKIERAKLLEHRQMFLLQRLTLPLPLSLPLPLPLPFPTQLQFLKHPSPANIKSTSLFAVCPPHSFVCSCHRPLSHLSNIPGSSPFIFFGLGRSSSLPATRLLDSNKELSEIWIARILYVCSFQINIATGVGS